MLDSLKNKLGSALGSIRGAKRLSEKAVDESLREVRRALIEADVALPVIKEFIESVKSRAADSEVLRSQTQAQAVITIVYEELKRIMGDSQSSLELSGGAPAVILMAGLQGSGKTTTAAKLAAYLKRQENKKVALASIDIYRPAAVDQLRRLSESVDALFFETDVTQEPLQIAQSAIAFARQQLADVIIVDTAGRTHVDDEMMAEIQAVQSQLRPAETLFVIDAMIGQDAVRSAQAFDQVLALTGVVVTKLDSDTRGGALLSVCHVTGKPLKFIGVGEHMDALEQFHPDRMASRILDMGDIATLIETVKQKADQDKAEKYARKMQAGGRIDLSDYREQISMAQDMGGFEKVFSMMPGISNAKLPDMTEFAKAARREMALIDSMTPHERRHPAIIRGPRRSRIAKGAGLEPRHVNQLLRKFEKIQKSTRRMAKDQGRGLAKKLQQMAGQIQGP